jgi:membrane protein DedA with SNARE-associated domain
LAVWFARAPCDLTPAERDAMSTLLVLLSTCALAFAMNAVALPLPPTWVVLAIIHNTTHVPILPLTFFGTLGATFGRGAFALSTRYFNTKLPPKMQTNATALASAVHRRARWATPFVALYCFLPLPSNPLFVAVGMDALPLAQSMTGYFIGRWANNTLTLLVAKPVAGSIRDLFAHALSWRSLAQAAVAIVAYLIFLNLPWKRWLHLDTPASAYPAADQGGAEQRPAG